MTTQEAVATNVTKEIVRTTSAVDFHKSVVSSDKASSKKWVTMGEYFKGKSFHEGSILPPKTEKGSFDNKEFTKDFKEELAKSGLVEPGTVRQFQQYISVLFNTKSIIMEHGACEVEYPKGTQLLVGLKDLFSFQKTGKVAPKPIFDKVVQSVKIDKSAIERLRVMTASYETVTKEVTADDLAELAVLIKRLTDTKAAMEELYTAQEPLKAVVNG